MDRRCLSGSAPSGAPSRRTTVTWRASPFHVSILCFVFPSLKNKTPGYWNSWDRMVPLIQKGQEPRLWTWRCWFSPQLLDTQLQSTPSWAKSLWEGAVGVRCGAEMTCTGLKKGQSKSFPVTTLLCNRCHGNFTMSGFKWWSVSPTNALFLVCWCCTSTLRSARPWTPKRVSLKTIHVSKMLVFYWNHTGRLPWKEGLKLLLPPPPGALFWKGCCNTTLPFTTYKVNRKHKFNFVVYPHNIYYHYCGIFVLLVQY